MRADAALAALLALAAVSPLKTLAAISDPHVLKCSEISSCDVPMKSMHSIVQARLD